MARGLNCPVACGILAPRPGIGPVPPAMEGKVLTTGPPGMSLRDSLNSVVLYSFQKFHTHNFFFFFSFIFISWKLITLQYCSDFYHTLT